MAIEVDRRGQRPALERRCLDVVVDLQLDVRPVALVELVADREVEAVETAFDRVTQQLAQVRAARPEARDLAVIVAGQYEVVAAAERQPERACGLRLADVEPAEMD